MDQVRSTPFVVFFVGNTHQPTRTGFVDLLIFGFSFQGGMTVPIWRGRRPLVPAPPNLAWGGIPPGFVASDIRHCQFQGYVWVQHYLWERRVQLPSESVACEKTTFVWDGKSSNLHGREHLKFNTSSGKTRVWVWGSNSKFGWTRDHRSHRCSSSQSSNTTSDQRANGKAKTVTSQQSPTQKRESNTVKHLMESGSWIYDENWAGWLAISHESRSKHP